MTGIAMRTDLNLSQAAVSEPFGSKVCARRPHRYDNFSSAGIKIHPLKRIAANLSRALPRSWRFPLAGLPPRSAHAFPSWTNLARVPNGMANELGAHLDRSGQYIPELTLGAGPFIESRFVQKQRFFPAVRTISGAVLSLAAEGHVNYYRWLMEGVPRLRYVFEERPAYEFIYCLQKRSFHRESLRVLGIDLARVIPSEENRFVQATEVVVPRYVDEFEPWVIPWLREKYLPLLKTSPADLPRRIYLTRRRATSRRILNEAELADRLAQLSVVVVALEEMSWLDQLALFRQAELIIGPHGAGLANLVFCPPSATAVEFIARDYPYTFYPEICRQVGLHHHFVYGEPAEPDMLDRSDLTVDLGAVEKLVRELVS